MPRILVIEDEPKVRRSLQVGLSGAGFEIDVAADGTDGLRLLGEKSWDCLILDWMLPGQDGIEVLRQMRQAGDSTPVLLLTARDAIDDRVQGLDGGADDYLVKPFAFAELLARIRALLRRGRIDATTMLRAGNLELDLLKRKVTREGVDLALKPREFEVLEYLVRHKNQTVTREMLGLDVWKEPGYVHTNVIEVYVNVLRKKIEIPGQSPRIVTIRGLGYCLEE